MQSKDFVAASSRPLLLALLAEGESYGYELIRKLKEHSGGAMEWTEGTLYPVLHRLEAEGGIVATWRAAENGRRRKYYQLTPLGKAQLTTEIENWQMVHQILQKLWKNSPSI